MIREIATLDIKPGEEDDFEAAVQMAVQLFQDAKGCRGLSLERSIENPSRYYLVVRWDTVDDHMVTFRESPDFQRWRELAGPHFASPPEVGHTETVLEGF
jgi:quinol monooxygenase YgiN